MSLTARVEIVGSDLDPDEADELTGRMRTELFELDVDAVEPIPAGPAPVGTRGPAELAQVGSLLVTLATPEVVGALVAALKDWRRGRVQAVRVTLDGDELVLDDASAEQQQAIVDAWLRRHGAA